MSDKPKDNPKQNPKGDPKRDKDRKQPKGDAAAATKDDGPPLKASGPPRLQKLYKETVAPKTMQEFGLRNVHQLPRLSKIVVNVGVGKQLENQKLKPEFRDTVVDTLGKITGQRPVMIKARKSVANFKVREGAPSSFMVTIRRERMWNFLDRLINLAIPRIKDFRGVKETAFDPAGSYSLGISEQAVWPEINMANVNFSHGMNINLVFENSNPKLSQFVLRELGMPFVRPEETRGGGAKK